MNTKCLAATEFQKSDSRIFVKCLAAAELAKAWHPYIPNVLKKLTKGRKTKHNKTKFKSLEARERSSRLKKAKIRIYPKNFNYLAGK